MEMDSKIAEMHEESKLLKNSLLFILNETGIFTFSFFGKHHCNGICV